jgi:hypothetical protein
MEDAWKLGNHFSLVPLVLPSVYNRQTCVLLTRA